MSVSKLTVELDGDVADLLENSVESGRFSSRDKAVNAALRTVLAQDAALENWLRNEVIPGHEEYLGDPASAVSAEKLLDRIRVGRPSPQA